MNGAETPYVTCDARGGLAAMVDAMALAHRATFRIAGQRIDVQSNDARVLRALCQRWRPFGVRPPLTSADAEVTRRYAIVDVGTPDARSPLAARLLTRCGAAFLPSLPARYVLVAGGQAPYAAERFGDALDVLDWAATTEALTTTSSHAVFHSAALSRNGRGVLLPGASGSGKTTLAAALVRAGFGYLSDEAALVDPSSGRVYAYPKALSIKRPALLAALLALPADLMTTAPADRERTWHVDARLLSSRCRRDSTLVDVIAFPRHDPARPTALRPLGRAAAALRLLRCGVNSLACPPHGVPLAAMLAAGAACYELTVNDLPAAVRLLTALCAPATGENGESSGETRDDIVGRQVGRS